MPDSGLLLSLSSLSVKDWQNCILFSSFLLFSSSFLPYVPCAFFSFFLLKDEKGGEKTVLTVYGG